MTSFSNAGPTRTRSASIHVRSGRRVPLSGPRGGPARATGVLSLDGRTAAFPADGSYVVRHDREQLELTLDAARLAGIHKIRYVVADETPPAFVDDIRRTFEELTRDMPPPRPELTIERLPATR